MKKANLQLNDFIRLSLALEAGFRAGRDWVTTLRWCASRDAKNSVRDFLKGLFSDLTTDTAENVIQMYRLRSSDMCWRLFFELLLQTSRGGYQMSQIFRTYSQIGMSIVKLKQREASFLFVPRFQAWGGLVMSIIFVSLLPSLAPDVFPSFVSLGRWDLFVSGLAFVALGFLLVRWLCLRPQRHLSHLLGTTFFFFFMGMYVESGLDLVSAWERSLQNVPLPRDLQSALKRPGLHVDSFDSFLEDLESKLSSPWPEILSGLGWVKATGNGVGDYLKGSAGRECERLLASWEDEIRKLSVFTLAPLILIMFPAALFLLLGPQVLELLRL